LSRVIVFSGVVGAGKTTHKRLLAKYLASRGYRVRDTILKTSYGLSYILLTMLCLVSRVRPGNKVSPIRMLIDERKSFFKRLFKLWLWVDVFSVFIEFIRRIYLPLRLGYTVVVVEDYIPAVITDYMFFSVKLGVPVESIVRQIRMIYRLDIAVKSRGYRVYSFFFDAEDRELYKRWVRRGSSIEYRDYIIVQKKLLYRITRFLYSDTVYIDTTREDIASIHRRIKELIKL